ncbi:MAG: hypothetical protein C4297_09520 [Gemmataceae bacterium]
MTIQELIQQLSRPEAYPFAVQQVEVRQTHISVVFLAGEFAYKIKKPVRFSFVDFSTLDKRRYYCRREIELNRRWAPFVYLDVVPVVAHGGQLCFEKDGEAVEYAVKMLRLPESGTLRFRVETDLATREEMNEIGQVIARLHIQAPRPPEDAYWTPLVVAQNLQDNLAQAFAHEGTTIRPAVLQRLVRALDRAFVAAAPIIDRRHRQGQVRDVHGDLRLEHIYHLAHQASSQHWAIVDCIEFNDTFRYIDPLADVAFLTMELKWEARSDLADALFDGYRALRPDPDADQLMPLYVGYRAAVRGKVETLSMEEPELGDYARARACQRARSFWLLALSELEPPESKPCLVLVAGLPGSGKSTLARLLAESAHFTVFRSDVVRKELAGISPHHKAPQEYYTAAWTQKTYEELEKRVEDCLFDGRRVIVDAVFPSEKRRQQFLQVARRWGVPVLLLLCQAPPEVIRQRLDNRSGDVSDADWQVYLQASARWQPLSSSTSRYTVAVDTSRPPEELLDQGLHALVQYGLWPSGRSDCGRAATSALQDAGDRS